MKARPPSRLSLLFRSHPFLVFNIISLYWNIASLASSAVIHIDIPVGYGYDIHAVTVHRSSLIAHLRLRINTSIYGPDIPNLVLHARYASYPYELIVDNALK